MSRIWSGMPVWKRERITQMTALLGAVTFYAAATLNPIAKSPLWFDEAYGARLIRYDLPTLTRYDALDVHPPLYYWMLKGWSALAGSDEPGLRSMSAAFGMVSLVLVMLLVRRLYDSHTACAAVVLVAISPMFVRYGMEARMYTMVVAIALAATWMLTRAMQEGRRGDYVWYGILVALGTWTHYMTVTIWLSHWVYRLLVIRSCHGPDSRNRIRHILASMFSKRWLLAHAVAVGLFLPWIGVLIKQVTAVSHGFWVPPVTARTPIDYLTQLLLFTVGDQVQGWRALVVFVLLTVVPVLVVRAYRDALDRTTAMTMLLMPVMAIGPVILMLLPPFNTLFVPRYLLTAVVCADVVMAVALACKANNGQGRLLKALLAVLLAVASVTGLQAAYRDRAYDVDGGLTKDLFAQVEAISGDSAAVVITRPYQYYVATYYAGHSLSVFLPETAFAKDSAGSLQPLRDDRSHQFKNLDELALRYRRIWVVDTHPDKASPSIPGIDGFKAVDTVTVFSPFDRSKRYRAIAYELGD